MARVPLTQPPRFPALVRRGAAAAAVGFTVSCGGQTSGSDSVQPPQPSGIDAGSTFVEPVDAAAADAGPGLDATASSEDVQTLADPNADAASDADNDGVAPDASVVVPPLPAPHPILPPK